MTVGCLVVATRIVSSWYSLWSENPDELGGTVCGKLHANELGIVVEVEVMPGEPGFARVLTVRGDVGWISGRLLTIVAGDPRKIL